jgi:hypothetical protein
MPTPNTNQKASAAPEVRTVSDILALSDADLCAFARSYKAADKYDGTADVIVEELWRRHLAKETPHARELREWQEFPGAVPSDSR